MSLSVDTLNTRLLTTHQTIERQIGRLNQNADDLLTNLLIVAFIFVLTLCVARWLSGLSRRFARRLSHAGADRTLPEFFAQLVNWLVWIIGAVAILQRFGVSTTSIVAVLGAMSLAIGLSLQGTLSNVASGILLLTQKPYRIGDIVTIGDTTGVIHRLGLFSTEITNGDNHRIFVPNAKISSDRIVNISHNGTRRIELLLEVGYGTDLEAALTLLRSLARAHPQVLPDPDIWAGVEAFRDSSIVLKLLAHTSVDAYGQVRADLLLDIRKSFDAHHIAAPYPHQVAVEGRRGTQA